MDVGLDCPECRIAMTFVARERRRDFARVLSGLKVEGRLRSLAVCAVCELHVAYMSNGRVHVLPSEVIVAMAGGAPAGVVLFQVTSEGEVNFQPVRDIGES